MRTKLIPLGLVASLSMCAAGCGNVHQGPSSSLVRIMALEAASGAKPDKFSGLLLSDVVTMVKVNSVNVPTVFNDTGQVTVAASLKDIGAPGATSAPSELNSVTFSNFRVRYHRTDGRNVEGVDVPYSFDSALTFTVAGNGTAKAVFELVRHTAKEEAPLRALQTSGAIINAIADVTFYGKDQAGRNVEVTGSLAINFGDFADPTS